MALNHDHRPIVKLILNHFSTEDMTDMFTLIRIQCVCIYTACEVTSVKTTVSIKKQNIGEHTQPHNTINTQVGKQIICVERFTDSSTGLSIYSAPPPFAHMQFSTCSVFEKTFGFTH